MNCDTATKDRVIGGFTVINEKTKSKAHNVQEVLPFWITKPELFSSDLKQSLSVNEVAKIGEFLRLRLSEIGITHFFPVQSAVIPYMLDCYFTSKHRPLCRPRDICICAPTGSGKTLAYAVPIIQLFLNRVHRFIRALIIVPVRDLAVQVYKTFSQLVNGTDIQVGVLAGIKSFSKEQEDIINLTNESYSVKVDIVIATPGRLVDHLYNTPGFSMERLRILVIDEADRVIVEEKQNWYHTLEDVLYYYTSSTNQNSWSNVSVRKRSRPIPTVGYHYDRSVDITLQKILVSATLTHDPEPLKQFNLYFPILFTSNRIRHDENHIDAVPHDHKNAENNSSEIKKQEKCDENREIPNVISHVKSSENHTTAGVGQFMVPESLEEFLVTAKPDIRVLFLVYLVRQKHKKRILCFANTVDCAKRLNMLLASFKGIKSKFLSSHLHPDKRQRILNLFSVGQCQILVCTDSMARGIDINDVECVVSYDVPPSIKIYIHRIGRTARAGKKGTAYNLLSTNQFYHFKKDLKLAGRKKIKQLQFHQSKWSHFNAEYQVALRNYEMSIKAMMIQLLILCTVSILSFTYADITVTTTPITMTLNNSVNTVQPYFNCNMTQHGFHLRLHCDFHDFSISLLEHCQLHLHLPSGFFIDPYELTSNQPNLKFSIIQPGIQQKLHSTIKQFVNWFTYSKLRKKITDHFDESKQLIIQNNLVDIEAPEWLAQPLTFKFNIDQLGINKSTSYLDLPIHLRYHLPSTKTDNTNGDSIYITEIKHPILNCPKDYNFKNINSQQSFSVIVPIPLLSYLVFVMPITILLLIIGVICLLMA